jgi:hypothetical protein
MRLAESGRVDRAKTLNLLSRAFYLATTVDQPIKLFGVTPFPTDTRSGYLAISYEVLPLDSLSLQSRAVGDMLSLDPAKARGLFQQIRFPTLSPVGCEEPLVYDPRPFYETLGKVVRSFTTNDKLKERHVDLLVPYVNTLQSHAQVKPVAKLLINADLALPELARLSDLFAGALSQLQGDERSFTSAIAPDNDLVTAVGKVITLQKGLEGITLLKALRLYLVSNFSRRCETGDEDKKGLPEAITTFNRQFRAALARMQIPPIHEEELQGIRIRVKIADRAFWQSAASKRLLTDLQRLRFGNGEKSLSTMARSKPAWSAQLEDFLTAMEAWNTEGETASDYFAQKSLLYEGAIDLIPNGPDRSRVIDSFVGYLEQNAAQATNPVEWFRPVNYLLSGARAEDDNDEVIQAFLNSRDSVLSLYARLERWNPRITKILTGN